MWLLARDAHPEMRKLSENCKSNISPKEIAIQDMSESGHYLKGILMEVMLTEVQI